MEYLIDAGDKKFRLDLFLAGRVPDLSRSRIKKLIKSKNITVNNLQTKAGYKLKKDDRVQVTIPPPEKNQLASEEIPLNILYEDPDIIVLNKPRGLTVHPGAGRKSGTLVNALLHLCRSLSVIGGVERPGIVHRLDKDTSGVLLIAKNDRAHQALSRQFKDRTIEKTYLALAEGIFKTDFGTISASIGRHPINRQKMTVDKSKSQNPNTKINPNSKPQKSKPKYREAVTDYKVLTRFKNFTLVELKPKTGRTHQIRVHLLSIGHPIVGDPIYGRKMFEGGNLDSRLQLHAYKIKFTHPSSGKTMEFQAEIPEDMEEFT